MNNQIYLEKENYITRFPDPEIWKLHPNYHILHASHKYIKGKTCDLGCNHGACTVFLLEFDNVTSINGYDINMNALEIAYKIAISKKSVIPISFICANLTNLPIENDTFDFIMSFHTLEHIYPTDADNVVKEIFRTLKNEGYFLISIPYDHAYPDPCHVAFFKEDSLKELFEKHGFITVECFKDDRYDQKDLLTGVFQKLALSS